MQRMLTRAGILVALLSPALAFAAFNDVTLTTDTVLSVGGITLNVSGSSAVVESITVNASNFSVTLPSGSTFEVTAPNLQQLQTDTSAGLAADICNSTQSKLGYAPTGSTVTVTITPISTLCSSGGSGGSAPSSSSSSSSSTVTSTPTTTTVTPTTTTTTTTTTVTPTTVTPTTVSTPTAAPSKLTATQIQSILNVLASFGADASIIASVKTSLGTPVGGSVTSTAVSIFKANLTVGSLGNEVKALQQFLNSRGYTVAASGAGSPGKETTRFGAATKAALIKYQKAKGISPASGYFGPLTRAAVNADR